MMPVTPVAGETRGFDAEDGADLSCTDFGNQSLKSRAFDQAGTGPPEILIDYGDIAKAQFACPIRQIVLAALTLLVVHHLPDG
jgi:hypothetical protein